MEIIPRFCRSLDLASVQKAFKFGGPRPILEPPFWKRWECRRNPIIGLCRLLLAGANPPEFVQAGLLSALPKVILAGSTRDSWAPVFIGNLSEGQREVSFKLAGFYRRRALCPPHSRLGQVTKSGAELTLQLHSLGTLRSVPEYACWFMEIS